MLGYGPKAGSCFSCELVRGALNPSPPYSSFTAHPHAQDSYMVLSGRKAAERRKKLQQQQLLLLPPPKQPQEQRWLSLQHQSILQDAVVRAIVALKARGGSSLHAVQRYLQDSFPSSDDTWRRQILSPKRVRTALGAVARKAGALWKLEPSEQHHENLAPAVSRTSNAAITPDNLAGNDGEDDDDDEEQRQYARLKDFIRRSEQRGVGHERKAAHFVCARTLHGAGA